MVHHGHPRRCFHQTGIRNATVHKALFSPPVSFRRRALWLRSSPGDLLFFFFAWLDYVLLSQSSMPEILVLYYSHRGAVREMARLLARGIEQVPGASARLRTVPQVSGVTTVAQPAVPDAGAPCELRGFGGVRRSRAGRRRASATWRRR